MRNLWIAGLSIVIGCSGSAAADSTTTTERPATTTMPTSVTTTSSTLPQTTTTTIDKEQERSASLSKLGLLVSELDVQAASASDEGLEKFEEDVRRIVAMVDSVKVGPVGWGFCVLAVTEVSNAVGNMVAGVRLWNEGVRDSDAERINAGKEFVIQLTDEADEAFAVAQTLCDGR